ncbi:MAG: hypothetical protein COV46_01435 [Deltaproteobacteria bacterium CG11_big_fil_rev_8_21_14_0_20_49_13]|nr:MAG: hypothetical protein COV46_01435 [Deltaproteobacteria bacterium CG11_big_fil_rev_8_21_14_0_20_49_13]
MLKRIIIAAAITLLMFQSGIFIFVSPLPLFFIFTVHGRREGRFTLLLTAALALLAVIFKVAHFYEVIYLSLFLMVGVILGEGVLRRVKLFQISIISILVPWVMLMGGFVLLNFGAGYDLIGSLKSYLNGTMGQIFSMQGSLASFSAPQAAFIKENMRSIVEFIVWTLPSMTMVFIAAVVSVTLLLARTFTKKYGVLKYFGNIAAQRFPFWPVWMTIFCGALFFLNGYFAESAFLKYMSINGLFVCAGIFFIQGCFVISFWMHKGRSPFLRLLVYGFIIAFLQVVGVIIIALGLSDQWIDFRKKRIKDQTMA